jgi:hypothetical protein
VVHALRQVTAFRQLQHIGVEPGIERHLGADRDLVGNRLAELVDVDLEPGRIGLLQSCNGPLRDRAISRRAAGGLHDGEQPVKRNG